MIEILNIFVQFFIFLAFFSFPINNLSTKFFTIKIPNNDFFSIISLNILIHLNLFLIISFLNIDIQKYFLLMLILGFFLLIDNFFKNITYWKKNTDNFFYKVLFVILIFAVFFDVSENLKLEWDALSHWIYKTKNFYYGYGINNLDKVSFAEYPHLGTFIWSFFWKNSILKLEYFGRLFFCFFYLVSIFNLANNILLKTSYYIKILVTTFIVFISYDIFLFSGYQGYLIFSILIIFSNFYLNLYNKEHSENYNFNFLFFLIIGFQSVIWFKDEGIFYFLIISSCSILFIKISLLKKIFLLFFSFSFPLIQFFIQKNIIGFYGFQADIIHSSLYELLNIKILFFKLFLITKYILISFVKYKLWIINLFSLFLIFFLDKKLFLNLKPWIIILLLNFALLYAIYLHTPYDLEFLLKVTLDRLLFQTSGFYLVFPLFLIKRLFNH